MIHILAPIVLALAAESDKENDTSLEESLGIWTGPIFNYNDLDRLKQEGWILSGYTVTIIRYDKKLIEMPNGELDYEKYSEYEVDNEPVDTLQAAISYQGQSWCEWKSSDPIKGILILSKDEKNVYTDVWSQYSLRIQRQDDRPLSKAELEYIDWQVQIEAFHEEESEDDSEDE